MAVAYPAQLGFDHFTPYDHHVTCHVQQDYVFENETESEYESDVDFDDGGEEEEDLEDGEPTVADQLLGFAEMVSRDIQRYFSRRKILEEKSERNAVEKANRPQLSGREQYYADLMKVVEGENSSDGTKKTMEPSGPQRYYYDSENNRGTPSGKTNSLAGLGGLEDLFEYAGRHDYPHLMHNVTAMRNDNQTPQMEKHRGILPWKRRNLPSSFFIEPNGGGKRQLFDFSTSDTPDFSDLMANIADEDTVSIPHATPVPCQACR